MRFAFAGRTPWITVEPDMKRKWGQVLPFAFGLPRRPPIQNSVQTEYLGSGFR